MSTDLNFVDNFGSIDEAQFSKLIRKNDAPFIQYSFFALARGHISKGHKNVSKVY